MRASFASPLHERGLGVNGDARPATVDERTNVGVIGSLGRREHVSVVLAEEARCCIVVQAVALRHSEDAPAAAVFTGTARDRANRKLQGGARGRKVSVALIRSAAQRHSSNEITLGTSNVRALRPSHRTPRRWP